MIDLFLIILTLAWLIFASLSDIKKREVFNWLNFSFIAFVLAYRAFYASFNSDYWYLLWGFIGLGIMLIIGNLFYYLRAFAGGDAKLLIALGVVLPFSSSFFGNLIILLVFVFLLMILGGIYSLIYSSFLAIIHKKEFKYQFIKIFKLNKKFVYIGLISAILSMILGFVDSLLLIISGVIALLPLVYVYSKAVEECCMIKTINSKDATIGDWLYETVKLKKGKIEPYWEGLSEEQVKILNKMNIKIKIKSGIPFVPSFLFAFLALVLLWESSWNIFQFFWF